MVFIAIARYHFPIIPWIAIYTDVGASVLLGARVTKPVAAPADIINAVLSLPYEFENRKAFAAGAESSGK